jgi:dipeptidyl aminopeptidase/acylaminoacyl peptidase
MSGSQRGQSGVRMVDFEQVVTATMLADVQLSPDGQWVTYVTTTASKEEHPQSAIWLVGATEGTPRRLTAGEAADGAPRWSPDGRWLAFTSDRKERGTPQLYLLALDGGEALRLTDQPGGVGDPQWSPDGRRIAFLARDAETDEERARKEARDDHKVVDGDWKRAGLYVLEVPDDLAGFGNAGLPEARRLSPPDLNIDLTIGPGLHSGFAWAPDSRGFVAIASRTPKADDGFRPQLITLDLDGELRSLGTYDGVWSRPTFSPDGSTIAFVGCEGEAPAYFALNVIPANGGPARTLLPGYAGSFRGHVWLPDGDRLLALTEEGQSNYLRVIDAESGSATVALTVPGGPGNSGGWFGVTPSVSRDGRRVAFAWANDASYGDVYVGDLDGEARQRTDLNPWLRDYDWGETRDISWTTFDGQEIEGILILPVGYQEGQRYPLLLQIHGGPMAAWTHRPFATWHDWGQLMAQRGYAVLLPNPRGSSGRGSAFLKGISGNYGDPDWRDLIAGVDALVERGIADPDQLVVGGWSGGGYLTNVTITKTDRFKAAVSGAGISNWVSFQGTADVRGAFDTYFGRVDEEPDNHWQHSPIRSIRHATTPTVILYGEADARVPVSQGYELYEGLKSRGVETQLVVYPREPHAIGERKHQLDLLRRVTEWYERHLGRIEQVEQ